MKNAAAHLPFMDVVFLTLLSLLALMIRANFEGAQALPVNLARAGGGAAVKTGKLVRLCVTEEGRLFLEKQEVEEEQLSSIPGGSRVLVSADRAAPCEVLLRVLGCLREAHHDVLLEVRKGESK
jgi:biopolymer transport protein ExbD